VATQLAALVHLYSTVFVSTVSRLLRSAIGVGRALACVDEFRIDIPVILSLVVATGQQNSKTKSTRMDSPAVHTYSALTSQVPGCSYVKPRNGYCMYDMKSKPIKLIYESLNLLEREMHFISTVLCSRLFLISVDI